MAAPLAHPVRAEPEPIVTPDGIVIRRCDALADYEACVALERATWGADFAEVVPATILRIANEVGGFTAAAFAPDGTVHGFVFGLAGVEDGAIIHWSHMLAVRPDARDGGLGTHLKRYQLAYLRALGAARIYWTFDPLVARNAHLNLARLGTRVVHYAVDFYGDGTGSELHKGLGTDRMIVCRDLDAADDAEGDGAPAAPRPGRIGAADGDGAPVANPVDDAELPAVLPAERLPRAAAVRVAVPADIHLVRQRSPAAARRWRESTRHAITSYLDRGYAVAAFLRSPGGGGHYLLRRLHDVPLSVQGDHS